MTPGAGYRDVLIEELSASEARLLWQVETLAERAVVAEAERDALRLVAVQGLHHIHELQTKLVTLTERYTLVLEESRQLRLERRQEGGRRAA